MKAIAKIIREDGRCPKNLHTDRRNFIRNVQKFLNNINHSIYSVMKASVVKRFDRMLNRTLKNDVETTFTHNGNYKWIGILPRLVSNYTMSANIELLVPFVIPAISVARCKGISRNLGRIIKKNKRGKKEFFVKIS